MTCGGPNGVRISVLRVGVAARAWAAALVMALLGAQPAPAQTFKVLYAFQGGTDGANPAGNLILDASGNLYGTTEYGGSGFGFGTVFKLDTAGNETVLYRFTGGADGNFPFGGLVQDSAGNLYGSTAEGGHSGCYDYGCGVVFKLDTTGNETVLYQFLGGSDGANPNGDLVRDAGGNLYGTAYWDPYQGLGAVFKVDENGSETVLHKFVGLPDGATPTSGLFQDNRGNLFGTTMAGGGGPCRGGCGTVFRVSKGGKETIVYRFLAAPDGRQPFAGLIPGAAGKFYGTTYSGGDLSCDDLGEGCGTVFEVSEAGGEKILHRFHADEGGYPWAGLVRDAAGNLYGATQGGNYGRVFKLDPQGKEELLHSFNGADGCSPLTSLTLDSAGNLYGTANECGGYGKGVVFEITR